jgi:hypothetical protein
MRRQINQDISKDISKPLFLLDAFFEVLDDTC